MVSCAGAAPQAALVLVANKVQPRPDLWYCVYCQAPNGHGWKPLYYCSLCPAAFHLGCYTQHTGRLLPLTNKAELEAFCCSTVCEQQQQQQRTAVASQRLPPGSQPASQQLPPGSQPASQQLSAAQQREIPMGPELRAPRASTAAPPPQVTTRH
jgi:hypothetical protein